MSAAYHHHGRIPVGRAIVAAACLLVVGVNAWLFAEAAAPSRPLPMLKLVVIISLVWMFAGAGLLWMRLALGRYLVLTILYAGSLGFFLAGAITECMDDAPLTGRVVPVFVAMAVYLVVSLVLTHSRHVRRLTSRAWA